MNEPIDEVCWIKGCQRKKGHRGYCSVDGEPRDAKCVICGDATRSPIRAALNHFRLVDWNQWKYWRGNIKTFGWMSGLKASLTLSFPILNTLWNWKHRKSRLQIPR